MDGESPAKASPTDSTYQPARASLNAKEGGSKDKGDPTSIWGKIFIVALIGGAIELIRSLFGHESTLAESRYTGALGVAAVVIWMLDDILERLGRILKEVEKNGSK